MGDKGVWEATKEVAIIIRPKLVSISTARKSVSKSSYSLCLMLCLIAIERFSV